MCGIAGAVGVSLSRESAEKMHRAISHRGPDDRGIEQMHDATLIHARLSIIDTSERGHQPMWNHAKTTAMVFNGEIYNFKELRKDLEKKGIQFTSGTDTEVILALYDTYGEMFVSMLGGMFAFALYDAKSKTLILARDRAGEKPLYYTHIQGGIVFASELKSILASGLVSTTLDRTALSDFLTLEYVPAPRTIFEGIKKLESGTVLLWKDGNLKMSSYWNVSQEKPYAFQDALHLLDTTLNRAVKNSLIADVPLGLFLSGGLDSATVAYYAQQHVGQPLKTFSAQFDDPSFDETSWATLASKHLGTDHTILPIRVHDALELVPRLGDLLDEPLADASCLPTYLLASLVRKHVTVALSGDGGDELFAGYPTFQAERIARYAAHLPRDVHTFLKQSAELLPASDKNFALPFTIQKFFEGIIEREPARRHGRWLQAFSREDQEKLLIEPQGEDPYRVWESPSRKLHGGNGLLYAYLKTYLGEGVLTKVDRMTMAHALESRAPLLSKEVLDIAFRISYDDKVRGFTTKYILKELMKDRLPHDIVFRKKKGFGVPLAKWLRGELRDIRDELLGDAYLKEQDLFNPSFVRTLCREHDAQRVDHRKKLWTLMSFMLWYNRWIA